MKYNININQVALAGSGLDFNDGAILDYLCVLAMSVNAEIARHRLWLQESEDQQHQAHTWVDYATMLVQMPMLPFNNRSQISRRVAKIESAGYIKTHRSPAGRLYFRLTEKADEIFTKREPEASQKPVANTQRSTIEPLQIRNAPVANTQQGRCENATYYNTNDYNTKIKDNTSTSDVVLIYQHFCKVFDKNPKRLMLSNARIRKINLRLKDAGKEMLLEAINNCQKDDFYSGRSKKWHGADLDWIIEKYENVEKLANLTPNRKPGSTPYIAREAKLPEPVVMTEAQQKRANEKMAEIRAKLQKRMAVK